MATGYRLGDPELTRAVYTRLVDTREEELCVHPGGNFIIQRLLDNIGDKVEFLELAERLGALLETVLASGCSGVVLSLVSSNSHFSIFLSSRCVTICDLIPGEGGPEAGLRADGDPQQAERGPALRWGQRGHHRPVPGLHADQGEEGGV